MGVSIKRFIIFTLWAIIYLKTHFGVLRNPYFIILVENNQLLLNILFIVIILISYYRDILASIKNIKLKTICIYSLIPAIILLFGNLLLLFLIFDSLVLESFSFSILFIINSLVIGPIYEEFIYRFIFINNNWQVKVKLAAVILSSLIFTFSHGVSVDGNIAMLVQFLMLGIGLGIIYIRTNNIFYCICTHFFYNSFVLLMSLV
ncbi:CPBP family intramembrane metalloprotease [Virgibacillus dakarensis]|uniref:CPBP family intramembrane glutamic endopeptidase n=1 Tax=Virgibacillus dakarensis TaxID=1917889 RepID=UPI000B453954|nr:CPBP family intramembrane metalloprotease [Virgibacillus dakarensis]